MTGLLALWDFAEHPGEPRKNAVNASLALHEGAGPVPRGEGGVFSGYHAVIGEPLYFVIPRKDIARLDRSGKNSEVTVLAWLRRQHKPGNECEFVAGCWNESRARRQYGLFLNLGIHESAQQAAAHVSHTGGPTPGHRWCMDAAIGQTPIPRGEWVCTGIIFDGQQASAWLNGRLDERTGRNPFPYPGELFDGGADGSDFTVGSVHRQGSMGNFLHADLAGLAIFGRALSAGEMESVARV